MFEPRLCKYAIVENNQTVLQFKAIISTTTVLAAFVLMVYNTTTSYLLVVYYDCI